MSNLAVIAYSSAAIAFAFLAILLVTGQRRQPLRGWFVLACVSTALWAGVQSYHLTANAVVPYLLLELLELLRAASWFGFLIAAIRGSTSLESNGSSVLRGIGIVALALPLGLLAALLLFLNVSSDSSLSRYAGNILGVGHLLLAVVGLVLVEQLYRNTGAEQRWGIKYLCFGIGGFFAFDFYLFSDALLVRQIDVDLWTARAIVYAFVVPLMAVSATRDTLWSSKVQISRDVAFHSAALLGAGVYLMVMAAAGYYIRAFGGHWGGVLQVVFFAGAAIVLAIVALSGRTRARLKVFVRKHFFKSKYDYRKEWLHFADVLSEGEDQHDIRQRILKAIAKIVESPSGIMWARTSNDKHFSPVALWNVNVPFGTTTTTSEPLVQFLNERQWVIDLAEYRSMPERYGHLQLPHWLQEFPKARLILPLFHQDDLDAFIVLGQPRVDMEFDWEDRDLLKTVGSEAASYLRLIETTEALSEARQFEAFNRLSAYVVHDLKNVAAQLSLVVTNARKHQHKPEFVADAVRTVENAVGRMNRMLAELRRQRSPTGSNEVVDLIQVLRDVVSERSSMRPIPRLSTDDGEAFVVADPDRLVAVIGHVIQNAQEATPDDGHVEVRLKLEGDWTVLGIQDTGCGMDEEFIRARLFRPFDTTKGNAGMGVGAYETREFVQGLGGEVGVVSQTGKGTTFYIRLPRARAIEQDRAAVSAVQ